MKRCENFNLLKDLPIKRPKTPNLYHYLLSIFFILTFNHVVASKYNQQIFSIREKTKFKKKEIAKREMQHRRSISGKVFIRTTPSINKTFNILYKINYAKKYQIQVRYIMITVNNFILIGSTDTRKNMFDFFNLFPKNSQLSCYKESTDLLGIDFEKLNKSIKNLYAGRSVKKEQEDLMKCDIPILSTLTNLKDLLYEHKKKKKKSVLAMLGLSSLEKKSKVKKADEKENELLAKILASAPRFSFIITTMNIKPLTGVTFQEEYYKWES